jgi:hypothetical protein
MKEMNFRKDAFKSQGKPRLLEVLKRVLGDWMVDSFLKVNERLEQVLNTGKGDPRVLIEKY